MISDGVNTVSTLRDPTLQDSLEVAFHRGDPDALAEVVRTYERRLLGLARRHTGGDVDEAEDLTQETWMRAAAARERYDTSASLWAWLASIMARVHIDRWRADVRRRRREVCAACAAFEENAAPPAALEELEFAERSAALRRAVGALPPGQQRIMMRYIYDEQPATLIARDLQCASGTVRATLTHAKRRLQRVLTR